MKTLGTSLHQYKQSPRGHYSEAGHEVSPCSIKLRQQGTNGKRRHTRPHKSLLIARSDHPRATSIRSVLQAPNVKNTPYNDPRRSARCTGVMKRCTPLRGE